MRGVSNKICKGALQIPAKRNGNRIPVEEEKSSVEKGHYIHPALFGEPEERGIEWARHPEMMKKAKERREARKQAAQQ